MKGYDYIHVETTTGEYLIEPPLGELRIRTDELGALHVELLVDSKHMNEDGSIYIETRTTPLAVFNSWRNVKLPGHEGIVNLVEPEKEIQQKQVDYQQLAPEDATVWVNEKGYEYTGETWKGLVAVRKYKQKEAVK